MPVFVTVAQFCKRHPAFTVGGMRHLLFFNPEGIREACIVRFGRRVLVDEAAFFAWLRANRGRSNLFDGSPKAAPKAKSAGTAARQTKKAGRRPSAIRV